MSVAIDDYIGAQPSTTYTAKDKAYMDLPGVDICPRTKINASLFYKENIEYEDLYDDEQMA